MKIYKIPEDQKLFVNIVSKLNEEFEPTCGYSSGQGINPGFSYEIKPLSFTLCQKGNDPIMNNRNNAYKHFPGDMVSGYCPYDQKKHRGMIKYLYYTPDGDGTKPELVYIQDFETEDTLPLEANSVKSVKFMTIKKQDNDEYFQEITAANDRMALFNTISNPIIENDGVSHSLQHINEMAAPKLTAIQKCEMIQQEYVNCKTEISKSNKLDYCITFGYGKYFSNGYDRSERDEIINDIRKKYGSFRFENGWKNSYGKYSNFCFHFKDGAGTNSEEFITNRKNADIEKERVEFEDKVSKANTDKYAPTPRDWQKMIEYMNKKSDPYRLADSCKDPNKIVARYIIAKTMNWESAVRAFGRKIFNEGILTDAEKEAYSRKYATYGMPEEFKELMNDYAQYDAKGGIAKRMKNDENDCSSEIPDKIVKWLDNNDKIVEYTTVKEPPFYENHIRSKSNHWYPYVINCKLFNEQEIVFRLYHDKAKDLWTHTISYYMKPTIAGVISNFEYQLNFKLEKIVMDF